MRPKSAASKMTRIGLIPKPNIAAAKAATNASQGPFSDVLPKDTVAFRNNGHDDGLKAIKQRNDRRERIGACIAS